MTLIVSTVGRDGSAHVAPMWYFMDEGRIVEMADRRDLFERPERCHVLPNDLAAVQEYMASHLNA